MFCAPAQREPSMTTAPLKQMLNMSVLVLFLPGFNFRVEVTWGGHAIKICWFSETIGAGEEFI